MLVFLAAAFTSRRRTSSASSRTSSDGIEVQVGMPPHAQLINIPKSALKSCLILAKRLTNGSAIVNVDADIFEIVIEELSRNHILDLIRPNAPLPLEKLISDENLMLKLAKAWHLAEMLDQQSVQNNLIETFRLHYLRLLKEGTQVPMYGDAFIYLRDNMGYRTKIEKFIIEFYAGLSRRQKRLSEEQLLCLPDHASRHVRERYAFLTGPGKKFDFIWDNNSGFKVTSCDNTRRTGLHIVPPPKSIADEIPSQALSPQASSTSRSQPRSTSISSRSSGPLPSQNRRYPQSVSEAPDDVVSESTNIRPSSPSRAPFYSARVPFGHPISIGFRRKPRMIIEESEDESEEEAGQSSASGLRRNRIDSHQGTNGAILE